MKAMVIAIWLEACWRSFNQGWPEALWISRLSWAVRYAQLEVHGASSDAWADRILG